MAKVALLGSRRHLDSVLALLHGLRVIELSDAGAEPGLDLPPVPATDERVKRAGLLRELGTRLDALLAVPSSDEKSRGSAPASADAGTTGDPGLSASIRGPFSTGSIDDALVALRQELDFLAPHVETLVRKLDALRAEEPALRRHARSVRRLLPFVPELTELEGYETVALILDARHARVVEFLRGELAALLEAEHEVVSARLDADTVGALLIFPRKRSREVHALLGREQVSELRLPPEFEGLPFQRALAAMERRIEELPAAIAATAAELDAILGPNRPRWAAARDALAARLAQEEAIRQVGATAHAFVLTGWVPRRDLPALRGALAARIGAEVQLDEVPLAHEDEARAPVLLENRPAAQPFEFLVRLLAVPRAGTLDPTPLMALFMPVFFGMMVGDVAHGVILGLAGWLVRRKLGARDPVWRDLGTILLMGSLWAIGFGVAFGEVLGDLGHRLFHMRPLWIGREEALEPLLAFAVAVGAAHVTLGLALGVWNAWRARHPHLVAEKAALLAGVCALFLLAGAAAGRLPAGLVTPAAAAAVAATATLMALGGPMGAITAPLELLGTVGNMLSYIRIAAIGLAGVYLSRVANELGAAAPLLLGIAVASFFHALNIALGAFSPTIAALRLHYVEFFGRFLEEGGRAFAPFGARPEAARAQ